MAARLELLEEVQNEAEGEEAEEEGLWVRGCNPFPLNSLVKEMQLIKTWRSFRECFFSLTEITAILSCDNSYQSKQLK